MNALRNTATFIGLALGMIAFLYFLGWAAGQDIFPRLTEKLGFEEYFTP